MKSTARLVNMDMIMVRHGTVGMKCVEHISVICVQKEMDIAAVMNKEIVQKVKKGFRKYGEGQKKT